MKQTNLYRINLKPATQDRQQLIDFCLATPKKQFLAIGWSYVYGENHNITDFKTYYDSVKTSVSRLNPVLNIFKDAEPNDLFWTRDLDGAYWICRVKEKAQSHYNKDLDIGAVLPVEAYKIGLEVPGQIKASFNRPRGGTSERLRNSAILEYSKSVYNQKSGQQTYAVQAIKNEVIGNLPDFELEELVISYIQVKYNYYLLSNSIANKSTTVAIEGELRSRDVKHPTKAVVQVKARNRTLKASDYQDFVDAGYKVFLYAANYEKNTNSNDFVFIDKTELTEFYKEHKAILPDEITKWENLI